MDRSSSSVSVDPSIHPSIHGSMDPSNHPWIHGSMMGKLLGMGESDFFVAFGGGDGIASMVGAVVIDHEVLLDPLELGAVEVVIGIRGRGGGGGGAIDVIGRAAFTLGRGRGRGGNTCFSSVEATVRGHEGGV